MLHRVKACREQITMSLTLHEMSGVRGSQTMEYEESMVSEAHNFTQGNLLAQEASGGKLYTM